MTAPDQLSIETPEQVALEFPLAGVGSRFLALAIDTLLQMTIGLLVLAAVSGAWSLLRPQIGRAVVPRRHRHRRVPAVLRVLRRVRGVLARADAGQAADRPPRAERHRAPGPDRRSHPAQPAARDRSAAGRLRHRHRHDAGVVAQPAARRSGRRHRRGAREGAVRSGDDGGDAGRRRRVDGGRPDRGRAPAGRDLPAAAPRNRAGGPRDACLRHRRAAARPARRLGARARSRSADRSAARAGPHHRPA